MKKILAHITLNRRMPKQGREDGQGLVEYMIMLALIAVAVIFIINLLEPTIANVFSRFVRQAPVAPPALLAYTPPATFTSTPAPVNTPPPGVTWTSTPVPSDTPPPTITSTPTITPTNTATPTATATTVCTYGPYAAPGRVQMENFTCGGQGVAFSDQSGDGGPGSGSYRADVGSEGPDLQITSDTGGGYHLGWAQGGEWLVYKVVATQARQYDFVVRIAAPHDQSPRIRIVVSHQYDTIDSGVRNAPTTGGWDVWQDFLITGMSLVAGENTIHFYVENAGANYNFFDITQFAPTPTPTALPVEVIKDNADSSGVTVTGIWQSSTHESGYYGSNYLHDQNNQKGSKSVRFTPNLPVAGNYQVYLRWTDSGSRATNVPVAITHAGGTANVTVNQQQNGGQWVLLGSYNFTAGTAGNVLISNAGTNGHVIADAVRFYKP